MKTYVVVDESGNSHTGLKVDTNMLTHGTKLSQETLKSMSATGASPELATLMSPVESANPRLLLIQSWDLATTDSKQADSQLICKIKVVSPTLMANPDQRLTFALLVFQHIYSDRDFKRWADRWLQGTERSAKAAVVTRKMLEEELECSAGMEDLAAWGVSGSDDHNTTRGMNDLTTRAIHITRAAEMFANQPIRNPEFVREIAQAVNRLGTHNDKIDMTQLAVRVLVDNKTPDTNARREAL